jgi:3-oxoacyl-[acyl-carrier protein] reductase
MTSLMSKQRANLEAVRSSTVYAGLTRVFAYETQEVYRSVHSSFLRVYPVEHKAAEFRGRRKTLKATTDCLYFAADDLLAVRDRSMALDGQVALVTGASRGIGAAIARLLANHGAAVAVNYRARKDAADKVVQQISENGGKALAIQADVRNEDQVASMVARLADQLGPVDILVLNAGMPVPFKPFMDLTSDEFYNKVFGEMQAFFYPLKAIVPSMMKRGHGNIIGISSGLSRHAGLGFSAHTTAKSGIDGLMKSLALELGPSGIRVNTVAPGLTVTDATAWQPKERFEAVAHVTPLRRVGQPEDIAGAVLALVSEECRFVTGNYISVSGGSLMI